MANDSTAVLFIHPLDFGIGVRFTCRLTGGNGIIIGVDCSIKKCSQFLVARLDKVLVDIRERSIHLPRYQNFGP